jgi:integrase
MYAGWKGNALENKSKSITAYMFPTWSGNAFWLLWKLYLAQRVLLSCRHPFAFVSADGRPYSIDAYKKAHRAALRRIGLIAAKALGTTPHGHRHAYGQRLADAGIDPVSRRVALHHKSLESQVVYTEPDREKLLRSLQAAEERESHDEGGAMPTVPDFLARGFRDVDPMELLSGAQRLLRK